MRAGSDWLTLPLKRIASVRLGKMIQSEVSGPGDIEAPFLRAAHVQPNGRIIEVDAKAMWFRPAELNSLTLRKGDVVVVEGGAGYGRSAVIREDLPGWGFQNSINRLRPVKGLAEGRFLDYVVQHSLHTGAVDLLVNTATIPHFTAEKLAELPVPVPPPDQQLAIADFLDRETAQIDAMIDAQQRLVKTLLARRIATVWYGVTKGFDNADLVASDVDWIGQVPRHWDVARLRNSIESAVPGVWGEDPRGDDSDVKCVRVADFDRPRNRVIASAVETVRSVDRSDRARRALMRGDLLLEKSGGTASNPVGFVARYESDEPAVYSNFIARLRLVPGQDSRYWNYAHTASYSTRLTQRSVKQTTGIQNLDQSAYFSESFPYPPAEEQKRVADHLDDVTERIDRLIATAERAIALMRERRSALITAAVTGHIDPRTGVERLDDIMEGAAS